MNNDLISRSALLKKECCGRISGDDVRNAPAVDAVEVVRCKNCMHYENGRCGHIMYIMDGYYRNTYEVKSPDDFCSIGERLDTEVDGDA